MDMVYDFGISVSSTIVGTVIATIIIEELKKKTS